MRKSPSRSQLSHHQRHDGSAGNGHAHQAGQFVGTFRLLFDGDGEQHRPDVGEAESRGNDAGERQGLRCPSSRRRRRAFPSRAERRKNRCAGVMIVSRTTPPRDRPIVSSRKNGRRAVRCWHRLSFKPEVSCSTGEQESSHADLGADVEEDAQARPGRRSAASAGRGSNAMLGGTSTLDSSTFNSSDRHKRDDHQDAEERESRRASSMLLEDGDRGDGAQAGTWRPCCRCP